MALAVFLITGHHLCAFQLCLEGYLCRQGHRGPASPMPQNVHVAKPPNKEKLYYYSIKNILEVLPSGPSRWSRPLRFVVLRISVGAPEIEQVRVP